MPPHGVQRPDGRKGRFVLESICKYMRRCTSKVFSRRKTPKTSSLQTYQPQTSAKQHRGTLTFYFSSTSVPVVGSCLKTGGRNLLLLRWGIQGRCRSGSWGARKGPLDRRGLSPLVYPTAGSACVRFSGDRWPRPAHPPYQHEVSRREGPGGGAGFPPAGIVSLLKTDRMLCAFFFPFKLPRYSVLELRMKTEAQILSSCLNWKINTGVGN